MGGERKVERRSTFLISSTSTLHCRHLDLGCNALLCRLQLFCFFGNLALHSFLVFCVLCVLLCCVDELWLRMCFMEMGSVRSMPREVFSR